VQSLPPWITYSGNAVGAGPATIALAVLPNPGPTRSSTVSIAGITLSVTQPGIPPAISAGGIVNAASFAAGSPLTPGSIATAYGNFPLLAPVSAAGSPLPTSLAGISLRFGNEMLAPLFFADVGQVNFQVPWELAGQTQTSLAVVLNGQAAAPQTVSLAPFSPGIFSANGEGFGQGAILNSSYELVDSARPAIAGSTIVQIYCTGLGAVTFAPETGSATPNVLISSRNGIMVTIGGVQASVIFAGLAPGSVGGYQVNALVPAGSAKGVAVPVVISLGGITSNTVSIAVQ
jgi:minor extracellular serine protease Vpr